METTDYTEELLTLSAYDGSAEAEELYTESLRRELSFHYDNNSMYRRFCDTKGFYPQEWD